MIDVDQLSALACGIIPADEIDRGAAAVNAGPCLAQRGGAYEEGVETARRIAKESYGREPSELNPAEMEKLLNLIYETNPAFYTQLRADVSALYLADPEVWKRIGFPGPSTRSGGYADFDQPQSPKIT